MSPAHTTADHPSIPVVNPDALPRPAGRYRNARDAIGPAAPQASADIVLPQDLQRNRSHAVEDRFTYHRRHPGTER
ncbi:hypothetical protein [Lysobacter gummosus]|uniref:hypothetical protein n=1 Tax=Lysobacter gummosus TaxID=262324 RepID=UPI0036334E4B